MAYWATFHFDPHPYRHYVSERRDVIATLDGWHCFVYDPKPYWMEDAPAITEGFVWADFKGAHNLDIFEVGESFAPVPVSSLEKIERMWTDEQIAEHKVKCDRNREIERELYASFDSDAPCRRIDLGSLRGFAGLILPDATSSVHYSWLTEGVALSWRGLRGHFIPIQGYASERLNGYGDNVFRNDGTLDQELLNDVLSECLGGWIVAPELAEISVEAAVWIRCERPLQTTDEWVEAGKEIAKDDHLAQRKHWRQCELLNSPFGGGTFDDDLQLDLIGQRAVLIWGNSD